jgi:hypothetical protein
LVADKLFALRDAKGWLKSWLTSGVTAVKFTSLKAESEMPGVNGFGPRFFLSLNGNQIDRVRAKTLGV